MHVDLYIIHITKIKLITELLNIFKIVLAYSKQLQSFNNKLGFYAQFSFLPVGDYRDLKDPFLIENKKKIKYEVQEQQDSNKSNIKREYLLILKVLRQPKKNFYATANFANCGWFLYNFSHYVRPNIK